MKGKEKKKVMELDMLTWKKYKGESVRRVHTGLSSRISLRSSLCLSEDMKRLSAAIKEETFCAFPSHPAPLLSNILFDLLSLIP